MSEQPSATTEKETSEELEVSVKALAETKYFLDLLKEKGIKGDKLETTLKEVFEKTTKQRSQPSPEHKQTS